MIGDRWAALGDRARRQRLELKLTQLRVAELSGVAKRLIGAFENGRLEYPLSPRVRHSLEQVLGWRTGSMTDFIGGGDIELAGSPLVIPRVTQMGDALQFDAAQPIDERLVGLAVIGKLMADTAEGVEAGERSEKDLVKLAYQCHHAISELLAHALGVSPSQAERIASGVAAVLGQDLNRVVGSSER